MSIRFSCVVATCLVAVVAVGACSDGDDGADGPGSGDELAATAGTSTTMTPTTMTPTTMTPTTLPATTATEPTVPPAAAADADADVVRCDAGATRVEVAAGRFAEIDHPGADGDPIGAVVLLHGYTGSPEAIRTTSELSDAAAAAGVVVAYPEGRPVPDQVGYGWDAGTDVYSVPTGEGDDDVAAVLATVDHLVADHCVDPGRVVLAGESNGGGMAVRVACDDRSHGRLRAVVPVIAAVGEATIAGCDADDGVELLAAAGTGDVVVPFDGFDVAEGSVLGQLDWFGRVATASNGCGPTSLDPLPGVGAVATVEPEGCQHPSRLAVVGGGDHRWPGGPASDVDVAPWSLNDLVLDLVGS
ncbi:MAG: PHB depolymerase family esterase [Actinomycetota bacterium]|nr:PHB depolymerase family esterase [Actinomycetota bacterium]